MSNYMPRKDVKMPPTVAEAAAYAAGYAQGLRDAEAICDQERHNTDVLASMPLQCAGVVAARNRIRDLLPPDAPAPEVTVEQAAQIILKDYVSDDSETDYNPAWDAWAMTMYIQKKDRYASMAAWLSALAGEQP